jgi:dihydrolipoamide dehydrogenase
MNESMRKDLVIVGGGPGGYTAAVRAAQLGRKVTLVEQADLGGICLNWGCIPTKALLASSDLYSRIQRAAEFGLQTSHVTFDYPAVVQRSRHIAARLSQGVAHLMKKNSVEVMAGKAAFRADGDLEIIQADGRVSTLTAEHIVLATGATARSLPGLPFDGDRILSSRDALGLGEVPASLAVIGSGAIGTEFASHFAALGTRVHLFELLPSLVPAADETMSAELLRAFKKRKISCYTSTSVQAVVPGTDGVTVRYQRQGKPEEEVVVDKVLVAVGVRPNSDGLGLEHVGIETHRGAVPVDRWCRTATPHIYAIGDLIGEPCLAHAASAEAIVAVEHASGANPTPVNYDNMPGCVYCHPQIAGVGLTESKAMQAGLPVKIGRFPFLASGKALAMGDNSGLVKIIAHADSGVVLGAHIVGPEATELIAELGLAITCQATVGQVLRTIHAHPTLSEAVMEAAGDCLGEAIHL